MLAIAGQQGAREVRDRKLHELTIEAKWSDGESVLCPGNRKSLDALGETVPYTRLGQKEFWVCGIQFEFVAKPGEINS